MIRYVCLYRCMLAFMCLMNVCFLGYVLCDAVLNERNGTLIAVAASVNLLIVTACIIDTISAITTKDRRKKKRI